MTARVLIAHAEHQWTRRIDVTAVELARMARDRRIEPALLDQVGDCRRDPAEAVGRRSQDLGWHRDTCSILGGRPV